MCLCGKDFEPFSPVQKWCGPDCGDARGRHSFRCAARQRARRDRAVLIATADRLSRTFGRMPLALLPGAACRECSICGRVLPEAGQWFGRRCGDCIREKSRRWRVAHPATSRVFAGGVCAHCQAGFLCVFFPSRGEHAIPRYCSIRCRNRHHQRIDARRRRAVARGVGAERIDIEVVARRDGWRCHICGRRCSRQNWSVDHLVPLSQGGLHTYANVALAHHLCNSVRSDTGMAQLRLVG